MLEIGFTFVLVFTLCLLFTVWKLKWIADEIRLNLAVRKLPLPSVTGDFFTGHFAAAFRQHLKGFSISPNYYYLQTILGVGHIMKDHAVFRGDIGFIKQIVTIHKVKAVSALLGNYQIIQKAAEYQLASPWVGAGLLTGSGPKWKKHRKLLNPAFHVKCLEGYHQIMSEQSRIMVQELRKRVEKNEDISAEETVASCALDILMESAMGEKIGSQLSGSTHIVKSLNRLLQLLTVRGRSPWLWPLFMFRLSPTGREFYKGLDTIRTFVNEVIPKRKESIRKEIEASGGRQIQFEDKHRRPFIDTLIIHNAYCQPEDKLTDKDIEDEIHTFNFAGYDTVTVTTYWCMYYIGLYPEVKRKLFEEMESIFDGDAERPITIDDVKHMEYLERVIKESQRLKPVAIGLVRVLENDLQIEGVTVPAGATVGVFVNSLHMDESVFPNPEVFDPDRFLGPEVDTFAFLPFSAGPRGCIGQRYAIMEVKTMIADLLRNFEWTSLDPRDKVLATIDVVPKPTSPLRIQFRDRLTPLST